MEKKLYFILNMFYKQMNANLCWGVGCAQQSKISLAAADSIV